MEAIKKIWKVWLTPNLLTKDVDNDYIAEVSTVGKTLRNEDLAQRIVDEGPEIKYDTLLSIINQRDRIVRDALQEGTSVLTRVCQITPQVIGSWIGATAKFDPEKHKITLNFVPSVEMRKALAQVGIEVLVVKDTNARIGLVTDTATNLTDGSITVGDDILINGERIRIAGEAEGVGVFFVNEGGVATPVTRRLTQNDPKTVIARVPTGLANGKYTLRIVTQYSNSAVLLKEPRTIEYDKLLVVGDDEEDDRPVIE